MSASLVLLLDSRSPARDLVGTVECGHVRDTDSLEVVVEPHALVERDAGWSRGD